MPRPTPSLEKLREIAAAIPTPFHLYDAGAIRANARALSSAFAWNEGFREYFAVKATPNPAILKILQSEGCGVDCASLTELMLADACGFSGDAIMFSSNVTPAEEYRYARSLDAIINLDDISHIDFLKENGGIPEQICLRYNPGGDFRLGNAVMGTPGDAKYGMTPEQMPEAVRKLQALGARRFGLHAFLASNTTDDSYYPTMARMLFELAAKLNRECGAEFFMVNLSGGIGVPYRPDERTANLRAIGAAVEKAYRETIVPAGMHPLRVVTELGRYMTAPHVHVGCGGHGLA